MAALVVIAAGMPAEPPPAVEVTIDGKPVPGVVRVEITTDQAELDGAPSPTGRDPRVLWSPQWQARWQKALVENHPWTEWLKFAVERPDTAYFDKTLFPTILYQITGDQAHARQAWERLKLTVDPANTPSSDGMRSNFLIWVICYEWLYPALSDDERAQVVAHLDRCVGLMANVVLGDSDRVVAYYFGVSIWAELGSEPAKAVLASEHYQLARQRLVDWAQLARGGEWLESTQYNRGTTATLLQGLDVLGQLGIEFPELAELPGDFATAAVHRMSSDLLAQWNWGATQDIWLHSLGRGDFLLPNWAVAAEVADSDPLRAQILRAWERGGHWQKPHAEFYLHARPDWTHKADSSQRLHTHHVVQGQQMLFARSSWEPDATFVGFRAGSNNQVHHHTFDAGNFQMWRRGEWVLTHPWIYDDLGTVDGRGGNNSLLVGNQPLNFTRREMLGAGVALYDTALKPVAHYMVLATGGPWRNGQDALEYLHSHTRWLVWLPGESDVILIRDVLDVDQPADQRYNPSGRKSKAYNIGAAWDRHAAYIESRLPGATAAPIPLVQWVIHAPVKPTPTFGLGVPTRLDWQTPGGQQVRATILLPNEPGEQPEVALLDERELFADIATWKVAEKERTWQIRVVPAGFESGKVELINAITIGEPVVVSLDGAAVKVGAKRVEFNETGIEVSQ